MLPPQTSSESDISAEDGHTPYRVSHRQRIVRFVREAEPYRVQRYVDDIALSGAPRTAVMRLVGLGLPDEPSMMPFLRWFRRRADHSLLCGTTAGEATLTPYPPAPHRDRSGRAGPARHRYD